MAKDLAPIQIRNLPDLLRVAEEVRATNVPRVLRLDDEDLAVVVPMPAKRRRAAPSEGDTYRVFLSAAGGWKDLVDPDALKRQIAHSRGSDRSPVEL